MGTGLLIRWGFNIEVPVKQFEILGAIHAGGRRKVT